MGVNTMPNISLTPEEFAAALPPSLPFEKNFNPSPPQEWMRQYWYLSMVGVAVYLCLVFGIQHLMRNHPPFKLQRLLELWNLSLAIFSIVGIVKVVPTLLFLLQRHGFWSTLCVSYHDEEYMRPTVFWTYMFAYSKVVELGDTLFIVLRKRPLIFLHWYHHVTVLVYTWYSFSDSSPSGLWFIAMNYSVHGFMYTYYSLRAMSYRIPKLVAMSLTTLQILQMIMGCFINYSAYAFRQSPQGCLVSRENIIASSVIYGSYWLLFCRFFYNAYVHPRRRPQTTAPATTTIGNGTAHKTTNHTNGYTNGHLPVKNGYTNGHVHHTNGHATVVHSEGSNGHTNGDLHYRSNGKKNGFNRFVPLLEQMGAGKSTEKLE